ncbi:Gfo/Idh/MocA family protein [Phenylobacterium montanum]|uniref:Gfo/Idh/MocA family oxidoreductase n=1 Tax=Phenylobacterium montanum TaxID=2823693 RepID=A0A975G1T0_9CAUL|nr:Gfo/Idh/MocA family oxidoreductase [Caulobacter sp. S6]QUD89305.1 Gfo/Idh/MocA family oxidoreductase [Caulobacter sp. S6]
MVRVGVIGLGKMGLSHYAIVRAHPEVEIAGVCDTTGYLLEVLNKYTGARVYPDYQQLLDKEPLDALIVATPTRLHAGIVREALNRGLHVFCEKPFCLDPNESAELAALAEERNLVNQVGYHYRFVGAFQEVKRLLDLKVLGPISHVLAEAYGPVVLRPKGSTWRSQRNEGGGCLYDYAAHPINLLNWYFGEPVAAAGTSLTKIFSNDIEDEVSSTLLFDPGISAQLSVNWSDESQRKMSTKVTIWGANGKISADRQECQTFLRDARAAPEGYREGWTIRYTTDLTEPVWYYLRGEEYSSQIDHFIKSIQARTAAQNSFASAAETDRVIGMMIADAQAGPRQSSPPLAGRARPGRRFSLFGR